MTGRYVVSVEGKVLGIFDDLMLALKFVNLFKAEDPGKTYVCENQTDYDYCACCETCTTADDRL